MVEHYNVTLSWGSAEKGNYSEAVMAEGQDAARRTLAEEMADHPDAPEFDSDNEREEWIEDRINGFNDVYTVSDQLTQNMATHFAQELFDGGHVRQINLAELGKVLSENRERILAAAQANTYQGMVGEAHTQPRQTSKAKVVSQPERN